VRCQRRRLATIVAETLVMLCTYRCVSERNEASQLREEATLPIEELLERYGGAGILVNRAFANMKKAGGAAGKVFSPVIHAKPNQAEEDSDGSASDNPAADVDTLAGTSEKDSVCVNLADSVSNGFCKSDGGDTKPPSAAKTVADSETSAVSATVSIQENGTASSSSACCDSSAAECSGASREHSETAADASGAATAADCDETAGTSAEATPGPSASTSEVQMNRQ